ncbi:MULTISPECIES: formate dehydrogenase subunit gamma [Roseobacteraceae]|uniref:formate dehydrogenase subunit gamma n=1 Tax=Roseobacteraceae TaxID=2854170 RepID=UPI00186A629D|nr:MULTISPECIES: formate dehydrogenase subunit gamma [Roseobacteraceae]|tara:strand:+ start:2760 stop:3254 length:495 start_codon:yes stop_codon:yes gene_type:complete
MRTPMPAQSDLTSPDATDIEAVIRPFLALEGPLLPMLHALQEVYGYVPETAHAPLCAALNITRAELKGVLSFYHDFRTRPSGKHVLKICRAEACQAMGATAMADRLLKKLGLEWHGTTANGAVTVEPVYCLGLCACAPAAMVDGKVIGRVGDARLDTVLAEVGA